MDSGVPLYLHTSSVSGLLLLGTTVHEQCRLVSDIGCDPVGTCADLLSRVLERGGGIHLQYELELREQL